MTGSLTINQEKALRKIRGAIQEKKIDAHEQRANNDFRAKRTHYEKLAYLVSEYRSEQQTATGQAGSATRRGELIKKIDLELAAIKAP